MQDIYGNRLLNKWINEEKIRFFHKKKKKLTQFELFAVYKMFWDLELTWALYGSKAVWGGRGRESEEVLCYKTGSRGLQVCSLETVLSEITFCTQNEAKEGARH